MTRDENLRALSYEYMKPELPCEIMNFSLSKPAEDYLKGVLPDFVEFMSKQELVPSLSHSRGSRSKKDGRVVWEYNGPLFLLAGQKREALRVGKYYDVLGYLLWIEEIDSRILKDRVLTFMKVGRPEPREFLVIENAPDNYFDVAMRGNSTSCCELKTKPDV